MSDSLADSYTLALECDRQSAFGGVIALSSEIDDDTAAAINAGPNADVIIAPGYAPGVCARIHARRVSTRILEAPGETAFDLHAPWTLRQLGDDFLLQDVDNSSEIDISAWRVVTTRRPTSDERADALFAWQVCAATVSNAVVLVRNRVAWGIGAGQQNRAEAGRLAAAKANGRADGGACASDGFYPFVDGIEAAAAAGAAVVVQPGGSINDDKVIAAADACGLAMLFTSRRRFRH